MNIHGFMRSRITKDIFAVRMSRDGQITGGFGPVREEEILIYDTEPLYPYSKSIGALIQNNREEFQIIYLKADGLPNVEIVGG